MKDFLFFYEEKIYLYGELFIIKDDSCSNCYFHDNNCDHLPFACIDNTNGNWDYTFEEISYI